MSKELRNVIKSINEYTKKHNGNVDVICSVMAFKGKNFDIVDDRLLVCGLKKSLLINLNELKKQITKEKKEFICY